MFPESAFSFCCALPLFLPLPLPLPPPPPPPPLPSPSTSPLPPSSAELSLTSTQSPTILDDFARLFCFFVCFVKFQFQVDGDLQGCKDGWVVYTYMLCSFSTFALSVVVEGGITVVSTRGKEGGGVHSISCMAVVVWP